MANNDSSQTARERSNWLIYSLVIAGIPIMGYILAWTYELAFCSVFHIPRELIAVSWTNIIIAISSIIGSAVIILGLLQIPISLRTLGIRPRNIIIRRLIVHLVMFSFFGIIFMVYSSYIPNLAMVLLFPLPFLFRDFGAPLIQQRKVSGYRSKLEAQEEQHKSQASPEVPTFIRKHLSTILLVIVVFLLFLILAHFEGTKSALDKEHFLVPSAYPQSVVLKVYDDTMICSPIDRETKQVSEIFFFIEVGSDSSLKFTMEKVGPLIVKQ